MKRESGSYDELRIHKSRRVGRYCSLEKFCERSSNRKKKKTEENLHLTIIY